MVVDMGSSPGVGKEVPRAERASKLIPVGFINLAIDADYFSICRKPGGESAFLIGEWPSYLIGFELLCLIFFALVCLPMRWTDGRPAPLAQSFPSPRREASSQPS